MEDRSVIKHILAVIGAIVVIAGIAYAVYEFIIRPNQLLACEKDYEDNFDDDDVFDEDFDD